VPDIKTVQTQAPASQVQSNNQVANTNSTSTAAVANLSPVKVDDLNKVLEDVNTMKSKQKLVDDSLFSVKK
jgi:hypothetical protein